MFKFLVLLVVLGLTAARAIEVVSDTLPAAELAEIAAADLVNEPYVKEPVVEMDISEILVEMGDVDMDIDAADQVKLGSLGR